MGSALAGKVALVTGSSHGLGRAMAERLARDGALVAVHGRDRDAAHEVVAAIESEGGSAFSICVELGPAGDVDALFAELDEGLRARTGDGSLDILVNNAGFSCTQPFEELTPEVFDSLVAVNARAPLFIIQRALGRLREGGRIVNISTGLTRFPWPQEMAYAMSKGALDMLALHLAKHVGPRGITINTVAPGTSDNGRGTLDGDPAAAAAIAELSAFGRWGEAATIADVVAFLVGHDGRWVTGAWIDATGGALV